MPRFYIFIGSNDGALVALKVPSPVAVDPEGYKVWLQANGLEDADSVLIAETQIEQLLAAIGAAVKS